VESCCQMSRRLRGQSSEEYTRYELWRHETENDHQSSKSSMPSSIPDTSIRRTIHPSNQRAFRISCWHPYQSLSPSAAQSGHLPQHSRMPSTQPPIHRPRLAIDIATFLAAQEERHSRNLVRQAPSLQRVQLPDFLSTASRSRSIVYMCRHAGLDEAGTDGIAPDASPGELVGGRLHHGDDGGFGGRVVGRPGVGP